MVGMNVWDAYINSEISEKDFAMLMGVHTSGLETYFKAETLPTSTLDNLAIALGVDVGTLMRPRPYRITLTEGERQAFDMMSGRGYGMDDVESVLTDCMPYDTEWSQDGDITFYLTESEAWQIGEIREKCGPECWTCFSDDLVQKLENFLGKIV